jgi:PilZ domain
MHTLRRGSPRRHHYRAAKIQLKDGALAHDCLVINLSKGGVRLNVEGLDIPDEFVLLLDSDGIVKKSTCKVAWRFDDEIGAQFVAPFEQPDLAEPDKLSA